MNDNKKAIDKLTEMAWRWHPTQGKPWHLKYGSQSKPWDAAGWQP